MKRLWTLQEAILPRNTWINFANKPWELETIREDLLSMRKTDNLHRIIGMDLTGRLIDLNIQSLQWISCLSTIGIASKCLSTTKAIAAPFFFVVFSQHRCSGSSRRANCF